MEAIGVVASVLVIANLVGAAVDVAQKYSRALHGDERFEIIFWKLWTEKHITSAWFSNIRRNPTAIPPDAQTDVDMILQNLRISYDKVENRMEKFQPLKGGKLSRDPRTRIAWLMNGYEDLKTLVELVQALNTALRTAVPPLPAYPGGQESPPTADSSQLNRGRVSQQRPTTMRPAPIRQTTHQQFELEDPFPVTRLERTDSLVRECYQTCRLVATDMVRLSAEAVEAAGLAAIEHRLNVWGSGLFGGLLGLELILGQKEPVAMKVRDLLLSAFVEVAFTQEQMLSRRAKTSSRPEPRLERCRTRLNSLLTDEGLTLLVVEKWHSTVTEDEEAALSSTKDDIGYLGGVLEMLFDVIPVIRSLRRAAVLKQERLKEAAVSETPTSQAIPQHGSELVDMVMTNLRKAKAVNRAAVSMIDEYPAESEISVGLLLHSKRLAKTVKCLEEWKLDAEDDTDVAARADVKDVVAKQKELARQLDSFIAKTSTRPLSSGWSRDRLLLPSEKKSLAGPHDPGLSAGDLESLVSMCDEATRYLYASSTV